MIGPDDRRRDAQRSRAAQGFLFDASFYCLIWLRERADPVRDTNGDGTRQFLPGALLINGTEILLGALGSTARIARQMT
jgi:hypothetical protein